jgi:hypothetical protein
VWSVSGTSETNGFGKFRSAIGATPDLISLRREEALR